MIRFVIALASGLLSVASNAAGPASRLHSQLNAGSARYFDAKGKPADWAVGASARSVLFVLDPRRRLSRELIDTLARNGYEGDQARVVVLGRDAAATAFEARVGATLPRAQWVFAERADIDANLVLMGSPLVLGLDAGHHIAWRASGVQRDSRDLLVRIADWTGLAAAPH